METFYGIKENTMDYQVRFYQDNIYEVIEFGYSAVFQGTLADCKAWIDLHEKGYL